MSDLIKRQDAIMHFVKASENYECGIFSLAEVTHELWEIPSAEPEIIRCKDCEYFRTPKDENNYCDHDFAGIRHVPFADDYCSYAERKRDAD